MAEFSAMMRQYLEIKAQHKENLVFFRLGDFYELFFDDARLAAEKLGLVLTSRDTGQGKASMCGVPHHAAEGYILRLVDMGHRVALCEQVGDAPKGGLMPRQVVRVYTPGTVMQDEGNGYIAAVFQGKGAFGLAYCDVATGEFLATTLDTEGKLLDELHKIAPVEIIANPDLRPIEAIKNNIGPVPNIYHFWAFLHDVARDKLLGHFGVANLEGYGLVDEPATCAAGALLHYLSEMQAASLAHITTVSTYAVTNYMILDKNTRRNLELTETLWDKGVAGTLLWVLDKTRTAMGGRLLRKWLENPLLDINDINTRQEAVGEYAENAALRGDVAVQLEKIADMERLCAKINYGRVTAGDLAALSNSMAAIADVKGLLDGASSGLNTYFAAEIDDLADVLSKIRAVIPEEAMPGQMIAAGYDQALDSMRMLKNQYIDALNVLENREREATGIKTLKIGHNKIFGHYIEVGNAHRAGLPSHYQRRQTLSGSERYTTHELQQLEMDILTVNEKISLAERELFIGLRTAVAGEIPRIQGAAHMVATVDALLSLGRIAAENSYVRPEMMQGGPIDIKDGRHPVVEQLLTETFVANDAYLDDEANKICIITGPNMAGKSTYLRQVALISIMAQMGSFVPAVAARLPVCDRVFTRVGAGDDLARGKSTFMVEMNEVANILNNATAKSLVILDEIGRGTSTADGFAIALAIVEHISQAVGAKTLFATHFHELTEAEGKIPSVVNYCMQVAEDGEDIRFLRKICRGGADSSYGIHVAKLAGLPAAVISRSAEIQKGLKVQGVFPEQPGQRRERVRIFLEEFGPELAPDQVKALKGLL
ncbi:MAG: DNA mismatch repair protein MutS [Defluviitaleaceae bacterium]|nr:DNA mismatch repair protein MutS [Defluviitaleaceae bacterium]